MRKLSTCWKLSTLPTDGVKSTGKVGRERRWLKLFGEARTRRWSKTEYRAVQDECGWREGEEDKTVIGLGAWKCSEWDLRAAGRHGNGGH